MIHHDLKCIFVHVPRCAGSSVEYWLCGKDWWSIDPASKHLTARQARHLYKDYWDSYFKFTILRDPLTRSLSCLKYADHFGLSQDGARIDFSGYRARFGPSVIVEYDYRFHARDAVRHPGQKAGQVYGNILDEPLDFIARFETLERDMERVRAELGVARKMDVHAERSVTQTLPPDPGTIDEIQSLYREDYRVFGF